MAKGGKERITPPSKKDLTATSKALRRYGSGPSGRVMADQSVAKRQGVKRYKKP